MSAQWAGRIEGPATVLLVVVACLCVTLGASSLASARTFIDTIGVETSSLLVADYGVDPADTEFAPLSPEIIESASSDRGVAQTVLPTAERPPALAARPASAGLPAPEDGPERPPVAPAASALPNAPPPAVSARPPGGAAPVDSGALGSVVEPPPAATALPTPVPTPTPKPASGGSTGVVAPVVNSTVGGLGDTLDATVPGLRLGDTLDELTQPLDPVTELVDDTLAPVTEILDPTVEGVLEPVEDLTEPLEPLLEDVVGGLLGGLFG